MTNKNLEIVLLSLGFEMKNHQHELTYINSAHRIAIMPAQTIREDSLSFYSDFLASFRERGYRAILLPQETWNTRSDIFTSQLRVYMGDFTSIHARMCKLMQVDDKQACDFLNKHHLLGCTNGYETIGIYHKELLTGIALFGRPLVLKYEPDQPVSYELIRYCSLKGTVIQGGLSKAIKHFYRKFKPDEIMTSIDLGQSDGGSFKKLGFKLKETTPPIVQAGQIVSIGNMRLIKSFTHA